MRRLGGKKSRHLRHVPLLGRALPRAVEPQDVRVVRAELFQLSPVERAEAVPRGVVLLALRRVRVPVLAVREHPRVERVRWRPDRRVLRVMPVEVREVQPELDPGAPHRLGIRRHEIAPRRGRCHGRVPRPVRVGNGRVPQRHPVVVLRGQNGVPGTGLGEQSGPGVGVVRAPREARGLRVVLVPRALAQVVGPALGGAVHRVDAPVKEDAQLRPPVPLLHRHVRIQPGGSSG